MDKETQPLTKSIINPSLNEFEEISTPLSENEIKADQPKPKDINYEKYGRTSVECEIIEFEIKQN
ncbi:MAG: hypothetical protein IH845_01130 [Nanoarchaeota archaeon]|nr:hypothetical protein [Nanoarchaeota archaeon]